MTDSRQETGLTPHTTLALSPPSFNMDKPDKEKKGHLHAIKNRFSPSSSKSPSRSPIPPDESSNKDQQRSWSLRKIFGKPAIAPTQPTSPLPPPLSNNPIPESPLSTYPIVIYVWLQRIIASRFISRYVPEWCAPIFTSRRMMGSPKTVDISAPQPLATPPAGKGEQTWGCLSILGTDWCR